MYFIPLLAMVAIQGITADTGSDTSDPSPRRCDMMEMVNLLKQLINQETLLRLKMEAKIQENSDTVTEINRLKESVSNMSIYLNNQFELNDVLLRRIEDLNYTVVNMSTALADLTADQEIAMQREGKTTMKPTSSTNVFHTSGRKELECKDIKNSNPSATSSIYRLHLANQGPFTAYYAYCDMTTDGGGWTVFQRRMDGSVGFHGDWQAYKIGFGNLSTEFWLGNDLLHYITENSKYQLRVDMETFSGEKAHAKYSTFRVADETSGYRLTVRGYSGTAGDDMAHVNGARFSTMDKDLDNDSRNCAQFFSSPFWWKHCGNTSPNGHYIKTGNYTYRSGYFGICWSKFKGYGTSMKTFSMMLRRV